MVLFFNAFKGRNPPAGRAGNESKNRKAVWFGYNYLLSQSESVEDLWIEDCNPLIQKITLKTL